jgi:hypothetical protein
MDCPSLSSAMGMGHKKDDKHIGDQKQSPKSLFSSFLAAISKRKRNNQTNFVFERAAVA